MNDGEVGSKVLGNSEDFVSRRDSVIKTKHCVLGSDCEYSLIHREHHRSD